MEREFPLRILEERPGKVVLSWDDLRFTVHAEAPLRGEGMCKLWLLGSHGRLLLGTLVPEYGKLALRRRFTVGEAERAGAWPPRGVCAELLWPLALDRPFPRPDLFCFAKVEGGRVSFAFDAEGDPVMPEPV